MFKILKNAWAVPDLRKKILIVLALILVFRFGSYIPVPGIDRTQLELLWFNQTGVGGLFNIISGCPLSQISIFAMSITPYINASIIIQLLTIAIPSLEAMAKEGEEGLAKRKEAEAAGIQLPQPAIRSVLWITPKCPPPKCGN